MNNRSSLHIVLLLLVVSLVFPGIPLFGQSDGTFLEDFEGDDFADRWWSYNDGSVFSCAPESPGYESGSALHLGFDVGLGSYPGCGVDVVNAELWTAATGLSFFWRSDLPSPNISLVLYIEDPTQTHPDIEGSTPFQVVLQTPGEAWAEATLPWSAFVKPEWVGEGGIGALDPARVSEMVFEVSESQSGSIWIDDLRLMVGTGTPQSQVGPGVSAVSGDKFALWTGGTQLRGINTWQRLVVPEFNGVEIDGDEFLGNGHVGPPYIQEDFDRLAALGANYVNISGPGLFTETAPYALDESVQANLDAMLAMIAHADMFAVITFRTGPGRSDWTFYDSNIEQWADPALVIEHVWTEQAAQDAWVEMWRHTAERYRDNPIVVGYDLMCEPNAAGRLLGSFEPDEFYPAYAGTLYDWNQFYPRLIEAIREVDTNTPILVSGMGWGAVRWLPYLEPVNDPRVVYMVHQYEPQDEYTHQEPPATNTYPGTIDLDYDGSPDTFDRAWLESYLSSTDAFRAEYGGVPVAVNEYGLVRWVPNAADFMRDEMAWFEQRGLNHAFWMWNPAWPPHQAENDDFDFLHGPDPNNHTAVQSSALIDVILDNWSRNTVRPSNFGG